MGKVIFKLQGMALWGLRSKHAEVPIPFDIKGQSPIPFGLKKTFLIPFGLSCQLKEDFPHTLCFITGNATAKHDVFATISEISP